ncbi:unnamed protein product [Paramecium octaurelia]|uniref:Uncharacterized protein n=1 Tax=Paramecium octaurelia TaxID=43137 RepID=A0A8S1T084_PAROT|nr:unnamed protein product [Paramecium octaurelia]
MFRQNNFLQNALNLHFLCQTNQKSRNSSIVNQINCIQERILVKSMNQFRRQIVFHII